VNWRGWQLSEHSKSQKFGTVLRRRYRHHRPRTIKSADRHRVQQQLSAGARVRGAFFARTNAIFDGLLHGALIYVNAI